MNIKETLGLKIREIRKKQGLSQEKFSEMIEMNPRQIIRIESGESFPTAENLEKIASSLGVSIQSLFENDYHDDIVTLKSRLFNMIDNLEEKDIRFLYIMVSHLN